MPTCPHCLKPIHKNARRRHIKTCAKNPGPQRLRELRESGLTIKEIAAEIGIPGNYNRVRQWLLDAGIGLRAAPTKPRRESVVEADRSRAVDSQGCARCPPERQDTCAQAVREKRPVACEGVLVAGKLVETEQWIAQGWWYHAQ